MNKIFILIIAFFTTLSVNAQTDFNKWSIDVGLGMNKAWTYRGQDKSLNFPHIGLSGRYMLNNSFGLKLGLDYNRFREEDLFSSVGIYSITGSSVINVGHILRFETFCDRLGLLANVGAGASFMSIKESDNRDRMLHGMVGFTPQFKISPRVSINLNLSTTLNILQGRRFDGSVQSQKFGLDGTYSNLSLGASFYLGKHDKHADWTPTEFGSNNDLSKYDAYEARIAELERKLKDTDNDGVVDDKDVEPNTKEGAIVDSKGKAVLDSDNDGIPDTVDACPTEAGMFSNDGCPDSDKDGVVDAKDKCPTIPGVIENNGCPAIDKEVEEVMHKALEGVHFQTGKDVLTSNSYAVLDQVVNVMKDHKDYFLEISGHTDNVGNTESNLKLSEDRVQSVVKYLKEKGVSEERIHANGFGETKPKATNDTDKGRAENRRVEFSVVFE